MNNRYYRPWSATNVPQNQDGSINSSYYHVVSPSVTGWGGRYPILPPVGQTWSPPMMTLIQPFYYPMMSYPLHFYSPLIATFGPTCNLYSHCIPMATRAIRQYHHTPEYTNELTSKVCDQVCHELLEKVLSDLIRDVVSTCIDDIVTSYLHKANLQMDFELSQQGCHDNRSNEIAGQNTVEADKDAFLRNTPPCNKLQLLSLDINNVFESLLVEMIFNELLLMIYDRHTGSVCPSTIILNDLLFEELMKLTGLTQ